MRAMIVANLAFLWHAIYNCIVLCCLKSTCTNSANCLTNQTYMQVSWSGIFLVFQLAMLSTDMSGNSQLNHLKYATLTISSLVVLLSGVLSGLIECSRKNLIIQILITFVMIILISPFGFMLFMLLKVIEAHCVGLIHCLCCGFCCFQNGSSGLSQ